MKSQYLINILVNFYLLSIEFVTFSVSSKTRLDLIFNKFRDLNYMVSFRSLKRQTKCLLAALSLSRFTPHQSQHWLSSYAVDKQSINQYRIDLVAYNSLSFWPDVYF